MQDISGKVQVRLCQRDRQLSARGKHANVVTVATARELAGCMWAIAQQVPVTPSGQQSSRLNDALPRLTNVQRTRRSPGVVSPSAALRGEERILEPRPRQAPDGGTSGGHQPTESSRINPRI
jgi:hypothetical protein